MSLFNKLIKRVSAAIMAVIISYSTTVSAAPVPSAVIQGGILAGFTNIHVAGYGLYDVSFSPSYQGIVYSSEFVTAAGEAALSLGTGNGVFQGTFYDLNPTETKGCNGFFHPNSLGCGWLTVFSETALGNSLNLRGGAFFNYGSPEDFRDRLTIISTSGRRDTNFPGVTFTDWTPSQISQVPIPAAVFMFAPVLLGLLGLRRKVKN